MEFLFIFLLASYGSTNIVTGSKLFAGVREYLAASRYWLLRKVGEIVKCPMCVGFYIGLFWYAVICDGAWCSKFDFEWLAFGAMASGFAWVMHVIMHRLGEDEL